MYTVKAQKNWIDSSNDDDRAERKTIIEETFATLDDAIIRYTELQNEYMPDEDLEYQNLKNRYHMVSITYKHFEFCSTYYGCGFSP